MEAVEKRSSAAYGLRLIITWTPAFPGASFAHLAPDDFSTASGEFLRDTHAAGRRRELISVGPICRTGASPYVSDLLSLRVKSLFKELFERPASIEELRFDLQPVHEPLLESRLGFQAAVFPDVLNRKPLVAKIPADEDPSMAVEGVSFRAHEGDAVAPDALPYSPEALLEDGECGDAVVLGASFHVTARFHAPCAQFPAEKHVGDLRLLEIGCKHFFVELGMNPGDRVGPDVHQSIDAVAAKESQEVEDPVVGMPYGEEFLRHLPHQTR